jgi:hypothetical protein
MSSGTTTTRAELRADKDAAAEHDALITRLIGATKSINAQIKEIERTGSVADPSLVEAARQRIADLRWNLFEVASTASAGYYSPEDVSAWVTHSMQMGAYFPIFEAKVIKGLALIERVPNAPLRERVLDYLEDSGRQWIDLIQNVKDALVAMESEAGGADFGAALYKFDSRDFRSNTIECFKYHLGLATRMNAKQVNCPFLITYERAAAIAHAIGISPMEAGV